MCFSWPTTVTGSVGIPLVYGGRFPTARTAYQHVGFRKVKVEQTSGRDAQPFGDLLDSKILLGHRRSPAMRVTPPDTAASAAVSHAGHMRRAPAAAASARAVALRVMTLSFIFLLSGILTGERFRTLSLLGTSFAHFLDLSSCLSAAMTAAMPASSVPIEVSASQMLFILVSFFPCGRLYSNSITIIMRAGRSFKRKPSQFNESKPSCRGRQNPTIIQKQPFYHREHKHNEKGQRWTEHMVGEYDQPNDTDTNQHEQHVKGTTNKAENPMLF